MTATTEQRGLFIAIDGPSGVGKTTLTRALCDRLRALGHDVHRTAEPSTGPIGALARMLTDTASGAVLACLYAADRCHHLDEEINPRLAAGQMVVSDRYLASGLVMQRLDGLTYDYLQAVNTHARLPDIAFIVTADTATVRARLTQRGAHNRYQRRSGSIDEELHCYAHAADYLEQRGGNVVRIDTTHLAPELVAAAALNDIERTVRGALEPR